MKKIKLTSNKYTVVDDIDFKYLNQWNWYCNKVRNTHYAKRYTKLKVILMHRVILERMGYTNFEISDHIDGDGLNNQRSNLRPVTDQQNRYNRSKYKRNTSGYKGVSWVPRLRRWRARIQINGKQIHLGYSIDLHSAAWLYDEKARECIGEYARLNNVKNRRLKTIKVLVDRRNKQ